MNCKLLTILLLLVSMAACAANNSPVEPKTPGKPVIVTDNQTAASSQNYTDSILVNGLQRSYLIHLPASYDKSRQWPLVIILHGGGGEAWNMNPLTGFNALADKEGFIVIYPDAYEHNWNDGRGAPSIKSQAQNIDDVSFISALIIRLEQDLSIDKKMIYATGISNGAIMSNRLGCELSDKIAAIAPVAGNIPEKTASTWSPSRAVSVLIINGTEDPLVPYNGGDVSFLSIKRGTVISVADTVKFWVTRDGCPGAPQMEQLPHINPADPTSTTVEKYTGCRDGTEVVLYRVNGGGHTWPGGLQYMSERFIGKTSRDFSATETIWQFFKLHPMKQ
ncbi:MAG: dienelactone hydrolase family protein [Chloroflexi bacterium]|nr:dienelactone hydrolase family protein [Chloroflexota bacterium]